MKSRRARPIGRIRRRRCGELLLLRRLNGGTDLALLMSRLGLAAFLIFQVHDNILNPERMDEFAQFLEAYRFPFASLAAPLIVFAQAVIALSLALGLATRWMGIALSIMFVVGLGVVHLPEPFNFWWPALALVLLGAIHATVGAGGLSLDAVIENSLVDQDRKSADL